MVANHDCTDDNNEITRLIQYQSHLLQYCLLPEQNKSWLEQKIRPLWQTIFSKVEVEPSVVAKIVELLDTLRESFYVSANDQVVDKINHLPKRLKQEWVELAYKEISGTTDGLLERYIEFLDREELAIPGQYYIQKNLICLKGLVKLIPEIERRINSRLEILGGNY